MLEQEDALPRPERHAACGNGDRLAGAREYHSEVRGHVVWPLGGVDEIVRILRHEALEELVQVRPRGGICIFIDDERGARVLDENRGGAGSHAAVADDVRDLVGDLARALALGADGE